MIINYYDVRKDERIIRGRRHRHGTSAESYTKILRRKHIARKTANDLHSRCGLRFLDESQKSM